MNIWSKYIDELIIVAPLQKTIKSAIDCCYNHRNIKFVEMQQINLLGFPQILKTAVRIPKISWQIFKAMRQADHIHLRCPGNIGLIGCVIQILFPNKKKTAKYAGNWDPKSKQPWSYRLQKWILSNTFLTRNMQVLVYGEWEKQSKNIKSFFTATYLELDKKEFQQKSLTQNIRFIFVGTLVKGKNPLYAIQLIEKLFKSGYSVHLDIYGEGEERACLEKYILDSNLGKIVALKGNQSKDILKIAYQNSHFVVLPSKSEGWPKVLAEAMFWGCVPIATKVSCVPFMLDFGKRGILVEMNIESDSTLIENVLIDQNLYDTMQTNGAEWSRKYTMDFFESEIKKLIL